MEGRQGGSSTERVSKCESVQNYLQTTVWSNRHPVRERDGQAAGREASPGLYRLPPALGPKGARAEVPVHRAQRVPHHVDDAE
jgi:hypothetical protein